jgi:hypothetical protein
MSLHFYALKVVNSNNTTLNCAAMVCKGVVEKHDFCGIQQKIPQTSDFPKKQDLNPLPHGDNAADIAKMFAKIFSRKSAFG